MRRIIWVSLLVLLILILGVAGNIYWTITSMSAEQVTDDLYMIHGLGGNVAVLRTGEGAVIVDTMTFPMQGELIRKKAKELTGEDVVAIINTHYHLDHTHGNPAFPPDTRVLSTERTLTHMKTIDADFWTGAAAELLPNETFGVSKTLRVGDKTIVLFHPGRGHTDGDLVVLFLEEQVMHTGDLHFNKLFPNIDLEAGGSVRLWIETIDAMLELPFRQIIPGHGPLTDAAGLKQYQAFLQELWDYAEMAAAEGWDLETTQAQAKLREAIDYQAITFFYVFTLDQDFVVRRAWEEATGAVPVEY